MENNPPLPHNPLTTSREPGRAQQGYGLQMAFPLHKENVVVAHLALSLVGKSKGVHPASFLGPELRMVPHRRRLLCSQIGAFPTIGQRL